MSTSSSQVIIPPVQPNPGFMPISCKPSTFSLITCKLSTTKSSTSEISTTEPYTSSTGNEPFLFVHKSSTSKLPTCVQFTTTSPTTKPLNNSKYSEFHVLLTDQWLNDYVIDSAQRLLKQQFSVCGLQSSLRGQNLSFDVIGLNKKYVLILHVKKNHWVTVTNINVYLDRGERDRAQIFDSMIPTKIELDVKKQICSFVRPLANVFRFDVMNILPQSNGNDCGFYAIVNAVEILYNNSPVSCAFDTSAMRKHLLQCLNDGKMEPFPKVGKRQMRFGSGVKHSEEEGILCICRMPRDDTSDVYFIMCSVCRVLFHKSCVNSSVNNFCNSWICSKCKVF